MPLWEGVIPIWSTTGDGSNQMPLLNLSYEIEPSHTCGSVQIQVAY
jgi:hypothetical protein